MIGLHCYRICCTVLLQSLFDIATIKLIGMPFFRCFSRDSVEGILAALETEGSDWGNKYLEVCLAISQLQIKAIILCLHVMLQRHCELHFQCNNVSYVYYTNLNLVLFFFLFMFSYDTFRFLVKR